MRAEDIKDRKTLKAWLGLRPLDDAQVVSTRAAMRVLPIWTSAMDQAWAKEIDVTALPVLRRVFTSGVARVYRTREVGHAVALASYEPAATSNETAMALAANASLFAANSAAGVIFGSTMNLESGCVETIEYAVEAATLADGSSYIWEQVREDARMAEAGQDTFSSRLWSVPNPSWFTLADRQGRAILQRKREIWSFWLRWWDGVLSGNQLDWELQRQVALIPDDIWKQGPSAVAEAIQKIEAAIPSQPESDPIERAVVALPPSSKEIVASFSSAVAQYHEDIPPTLEALLDFCRREIERLQGRNAPYATPNEQAEAQRQIRVLTTIYTTLEKLRDTIPADGALTPAQAERGEKLSRLFVRHFKEWPARNAEDVVDSTYRAALIGLTVTLAPMISVPVNYAVAAGVVLFGSKKLVDGFKAAKDLKDLAP